MLLSVCVARITETEDQSMERALERHSTMNTIGVRDNWASEGDQCRTFYLLFTSSIVCSCIYSYAFASVVPATIEFTTQTFQVNELNFTDTRASFSDAITIDGQTTINSGLYLYWPLVVGGMFGNHIVVAKVSFKSPMENAIHWQRRTKQLALTRNRFRCQLCQKENASFMPAYVSRHITLRSKI